MVYANLARDDVEVPQRGRRTIPSPVDGAPTWLAVVLAAYPEVETGWERISRAPANGVVAPAVEGNLCGRRDFNLPGDTRWLRNGFTKLPQGLKVA